MFLNHEIMIREPSFDAESLRSLGITEVSPRVGYATTYVLPGTGRALEDETLH